RRNNRKDKENKNVDKTPNFKHLSRSYSKSLNITTIHIHHCSLSLPLPLTHLVQESLEQVLRVLRPTSRLWMELARAEKHRFVADPFVGPIVCIHKVSLPPGRHHIILQGVPVVLRGDHALAVVQADDRLVVTTVSEGKLVRTHPGGQTHQLVPHADPKDGL